MVGAKNPADSTLPDWRSDQVLAEGPDEPRVRVAVPRTSLYTRHAEPSRNGRAGSFTFRISSRAVRGQFSNAASPADRLARSRRLSLRPFSPPRGIVSARLFDPWRPAANPRINFCARVARTQLPLRPTARTDAGEGVVSVRRLLSPDRRDRRLSSMYSCERASGDRLVFIIFTFVSREHSSIMQPHLFRFNSH